MIVVGIVLFGLIFLMGFVYGKKWQGYQITRVVDGDTLGVIDLRTGRNWRLRLWGIDAPEVKECKAKESKEELEKLVGGLSTKITILGVDGFGRLLGRIWVGNEEVVKQMAAGGWARVDPSVESVDKGDDPGLAVVGELRRAEAAAKESGLGIWSSDCLRK